MSPCCPPLVPEHRTIVSGATPVELGRRRIDPQVLARSLVFVATFSAIFILLGLGATAIGSFLFADKPLLNRIAGVMIIVMGVLWPRYSWFA